MATGQQQSGVLFYLQNGVRNKGEHYKKNYPINIIRGLAITQIIVAFIAALTQIIGIAQDFERNEIGTGIWSGLFFALAGALGIFSASKPTKCTVISFMVFNIISSLFALILVIFASIGLGNTRCYNYYYRDNYKCPDYSFAKAVLSIQVLIALIELAVSVVSAAVCCRAVCCRTKKPGQVHFQGQALQAGNVEHAGFPVAQTVMMPVASEAAMHPEDGDLRPDALLPPRYDETMNGLNREQVTNESVPDVGEKYQRF
jgi:hypothetical protein